MTLRSVLVLHNQPVLPRDHPDAESEHTVVEIAGEMAKVLEEAGYRVHQLGLGGDPTVLWRALAKRKPDVVFNLYEGNADNTQTESFVAGLLEWSGIPFTGSPYAALSLARAKHTTKHLLKGAGLPTADFQVVNALPVPDCTLEFPVIVKPAEQDGSVGLDQESVCTNKAQLAKRVRYVLATYGAPAIIEEYIEGREFNVGLVELPELQALVPMETVFLVPTGSWRIYTYGRKWNRGTAEYEETQSRLATDLSAAILAKLNRLAMQAYRLLGCQDYARADFRVTPSGKAYLLEVNPNPEISVGSDLTEALSSAGMPHSEFIVALVEQAARRRRATTPKLTPARRDTSRRARPA